MRTTEDAIRSLKRYLALVLGGPAPLAAAKLYASPDTADLSSIPEEDVLHDHDTTGALATLGLASAAAAAAAGLVRATTVGRTRFWVCPPGTAWDAGAGAAFDVALDPFAWSPSLVRGCVDVTPDDWARVLAADRWGIALELASGSGNPYRCAMLAGAPVLPGSGPQPPATLDDLERGDAAPLDGNWVGGFNGEQLPNLEGGEMVPSVKNMDSGASWGTLLGLDCQLWVELGAFVFDSAGTSGGDATIRVRVKSDAMVSFSFDTTGFGWAISQVDGNNEISDQRSDYSFQPGDLVGLRVVGSQAEVLLRRAGVETVLVSWTTNTVAGDIDATVEIGMWDTSGAQVLDGSEVFPLTIESVRGGDVVTGDPPTAVPADLLAAPDEWDVRFFHDEGEFEYPVCVVKSVGAPTLASNQNWYELTQAYAVYAYPTPPPSATGTPSEAHVAAERVRQLLISAFAAARADGARPMRIPLYDYEGLAANLPAAHREQADYMRVVGASVDLQPEPNDPRQTVVVADLRLNWRVPVGEVPGRGIVRSVELTTTET